jgi:hypothetical protein
MALTQARVPFGAWVQKDGVGLGQLDASDLNCGSTGLVVPAGFDLDAREEGLVVAASRALVGQSLKTPGTPATSASYPSPRNTDTGGMPRATAHERIGEFREELQAVLADAAGLLDAHEPADSKSWLALRKRLDDACQHMESATYCLYEWAEPDDSRADIIPIGKVGYRNIPATR